MNVIEDMDEPRDNYPNFNRVNRWLGIIDYKALIAVIIILVITWNFIGIFIDSQLYKVYITVIISIPLFGICYANKSEEDIVDVIYIALRYVFSTKLYVYSIESNHEWLK